MEKHFASIRAEIRKEQDLCEVSPDPSGKRQQTAMNDYKRKINRIRGKHR